MAFLSQVRSRGQQYIYLTEYRGKEQYSTRTEVNIFAFGNRENAVAKMYYWLENFHKFPKELVELGYGRKDLLEWIDTMETGISKTGRSNKFTLTS